MEFGSIREALAADKPDTDTSGKGGKSGGSSPDLQRKAALADILAKATKLHAEVDQWKQTYGYTGVADEIEWIRETSALLTNALLSLADFVDIGEDE